MTASVVERLAPTLDEIHGLGGGEKYWLRVLAPWLLILVSGVADRLLFLSVVAAVWPEAKALGQPPGEVPSTMADAVHTLRDAGGNAALMSMLAPGLGLEMVLAPAPQAAHAATASPLRRDLAGRAARDPRLAARLVADRGLARLSRLVIGRDRGRRVAVIGQTGMRGVDELALLRGVPGLRFPQGARPVHDDIPIADPVLRRSLPDASQADDSLEEAVLRVLPAVLPRSLLEGFDATREASRQGYGIPSAVVVGNYSADEIQNEFIARCAMAGHGVAFAQHGGFYGQADVHGQERLEVSPGSEFWCWGDRTEAQSRRVASPMLERLRNTHRGGSDVVLVEGVHPPDRYVMRFASSPLGNQADREAGRLEQLVLCAGSSRERMRLKRYPAQVGTDARPRVLAQLPHHGPRGIVGASGWIQRAAVAVIAYPDTPFIESLVIGAPTVGLWDPGLYEWRPDVRGLVEALVEARVVFSDPAAAARHLDSVADAPTAWWTSPAVIEARTRFVERFAPPGDWIADWTAGLVRLSASP